MPTNDPMQWVTAVEEIILEVCGFLRSELVPGYYVVLDECNDILWAEPVSKRLRL